MRSALALYPWAVLLLLQTVDLFTLRLPNRLVLPLALLSLVLALAGLIAWHWVGVLVGLVVGLVSDVPGGDLKALLLLGFLFPLVPFLVGCLFAYAVTLILWSRGYTEWPWVPFLGLGIALASVLPFV